MKNMDISTAVAAFLQQRGMGYEVPHDPLDTLTKAGVVPFVRTASGAIEYLVMKPVAAHPDLAPPKFQICKGTRMCRDGQEWVDMKNGVDTGGARESLIATALREGMEELGIRLDAITQIVNLDVHAFSSASSNASKQMHLFGLEMKSKACLYPLEHIADTTAQRGWTTLPAFKDQGRDDHYQILQQVDEIIRTSEIAHETRRT